MVTKFCRCVPLHIGCIILAGTAIIIGVGLLILSGGRWGEIFTGIFIIITFTPLLIGSIKNNEKLVFLNLVLYLVLIVIMIGFGTIAIVRIETFEPGFANNCATMPKELHRLHSTCDELKSVAIGISAGMNFSASFLGIYFCVCIYSFYKKLKGVDAVLD